MYNTGSLSRQESLVGAQFIGEVVDVTFSGNEKRGEARVRIESIHGDATETPDSNLPIATFEMQSSIDTFGTFNKGDKVTIEFPSGARHAPVIVGKVLNLESLSRVVPEYEGSYGKVMGTYSPNIDAAIFYNEATGAVHIRFVDGSDIEIKKGQIDIDSNTLNVNIKGKATVNAGSLTANVQGATNVTTNTANVTASGPISMTSASKVSISAPSVSINGM